MSFLDDLKQQATARRRQAQGDLAEIERHTALVEAACANAWRYLDEVQDVGKPADTTGYR